MLLPLLEITHGGVQKSHRILEASEASIAVVTQQAAGRPGSVIVVDCQSARSPTTTPVSFSNSADSTSAILLVEECLVFLGSVTLPADLRVLVCQNKAVAATVRPVTEPRKLFTDLLQPTVFTHRLPLTELSVLDPMKTLPNQVDSYRAERFPGPSGNLTDRETAAEEISNLVQSRYLKKKQ